jgi:hypothetical protein
LRQCCRWLHAEVIDNQFVAHARTNGCHCFACLPPFQLTLGRSYPRAELLTFSNAYEEWVGSLRAWPWLNIPFSPFAKALKARELMIQHFQEATDAGRAKLARGEEVPGLLGILISSVDEEGNRCAICVGIYLPLWVCYSAGCGRQACMQLPPLHTLRPSKGAAACMQLPLPASLTLQAVACFKYHDMAR